MKLYKAAVLSTMLVLLSINIVSAQDLSLPQIFSSPQIQGMLQQRAMRESQQIQQQILQRNPDLVEKLRNDRKVQEQFDSELAQVREQIYQRYQQQFIQIFQQGQNDLMQSTQAVIDKYRQLLSR